MAMEEGVSAAAMVSVAATERAVAALWLVLSRVQQAVAWSGRALESVRVVAVSKTKPVAVIRGVYDAGDHHFGENYVQGLLGKVPQIADRLNQVVADLGRKPLKVLVQVNTSGKECGKIWSRSLRMCRISKACQIGMLDYSSTPENSKIEMGSTNVSVGSTIFGAKEYPKKNQDYYTFRFCCNIVCIEYQQKLCSLRDGDIKFIELILM